MFSSSPSSVREALKSLGARLAEIRKDAGLTGRDLGRLMGCHSSKISRVEHGKQTPTADDIQNWCDECAAPEQAGDLIASLATVEGMFIEWQRMEQSGLLVAQEAMLPLWQRTNRFRVYSSWFLPGAVQTAGYTRAILQAIATRREIPDDIEESVQSRMRRLEMMHDAGKRFIILLEEATLRTVIAPPEVMIDQLGHLISMSSWPNVALGIIPMGIYREAWPVEDYWIYDQDQVNVELVSGWLTVTQPGEMRAYIEAFTQLSELAVHGPNARALITRAIDALDTPVAAGHGS